MRSESVCGICGIRTCAAIAEAQSFQFFRWYLRGFIDFLACLFLKGVFIYACAACIGYTGFRSLFFFVHLWVSKRACIFSGVLAYLTDLRCVASAFQHYGISMVYVSIWQFMEVSCDL